MANALIELKDVRKTYGTGFKTEVLKGISLEIKRGEFTSIIGPSGSGKSTLLNILGMLDKATSGEYIFNGVNINSKKDKDLAVLRNESLGFIFQSHLLLPEFTALENVLMPYYISKRFVGKDVIKRAKTLLEKVGVLDRGDYKSTNLSGGQQQRVAIARALMNGPQLVLADEPTGNLDSQTTDQVYALLRDINKEFSTTFIIVTHDRNIAEKSDRIFEVKDGNVMDSSQ